MLPSVFFIRFTICISLWVAAPLNPMDNDVSPQGKSKTLRLTEVLRFTADQGNHTTWIGPLAALKRITTAACTCSAPATKTSLSLVKPAHGSMLSAHSRPGPVNS